MAILQIDARILVDGKDSTRLNAPASAGDATLTVENITGFSVGQYILIGQFGEEQAEVVRLHTSTAPSGSTITLSTTLVYSHDINTKVTQIDYNQVEFSRATTTTGSKTVLTTKDIQVDEFLTSYTDLTNSSGYGFARFKNSATSVFTAYSGAIPYAGFSANSVKMMIESALDETRESISTLISADMLLRQLNNWQLHVASIKNWSHEATSTTSTVVSGQKTYTLPTDTKQTQEASGIIQVRIKNYEALHEIDKRMFDFNMVNTISTTLAASVALVDTTITLTDSSDFSTAGTITIGDDEITYTGNNTSTNILSGVTGITSIHSSGDTVWQSSSLAKPINFMVYDGSYYLEPVASTDYNGMTIYIDYYKNLATLTGDADTTEIPFYHLAQYYLAWKIELVKGNADKAEYYRQLHDGMLKTQARKDKPTQNFSFKVWK